MRMTSSEDLVFTDGSQEIFIKAGTNTMRGMDMVKCSGQMALFIKVCGTRVSSMAKVAWNSQIRRSKKEYFRIIFSKGLYTTD